MNSRGRIAVVLLTCISVLLAIYDLVWGPKSFWASLQDYGLVWAALLALVLVSIQQVRIFQQQQHQDARQKQILMDSLQVGVKLFDHQKGLTTPEGWCPGL